MGLGASKPDPAAEKAILVSKRKCAAFASGLTACRKANGGEGSAEATTQCKNLEIKLVSCWADDHCKPEADEHRKCYNKLYKTGMYKGLGHCIPSEDAMRACLRKQKLYPA